MKKFSTLVAVLALGAMTQINAEGRSWDFTNWSAETVANLKASNANGGNWSDIEKADGTAPTDISKDNVFWQVDATADVNADGYLMANGVVIKETEGLKYTNETNRSLAIAVNYGDVKGDGEFGPYKGAGYLWLGSSKKNYFLIPAVEPGTVIKMGVESHKLSDARGVQLYIGAGTEGAQLMGVDGNAVAAPTAYTEQAWQVPADLASATDIQIYNTNGCHIYYITVGDGGAALNTIAADNNAPVVYYNLQGQQVENPANGLFIRKQGNQVTKVVK